MKKCYTCQQDKSLTEFNKNKGKKDGLNSICRSCSKLRSQQYYKENREKHLKEVGANKLRYQKRNRQFVAEYLQKNPCVDCGETNLAKLEFDHRSDKENNVSTMAYSPVSLQKLKKEIAKCDVRCANCHRLKTAHDQNWWILKYMGLKH